MNRNENKKSRNCLKKVKKHGLLSAKSRRGARDRGHIYYLKQTRLWVKTGTGIRDSPYPPSGFMLVRLTVQQRGESRGSY